jgi:hypothetical protein
MFRQLTDIFRGLHVPRKLLQYCLRLGWMWIVVRSVWPAAVYLLVILHRKIKHSVSIGKVMRI